MISKAAAPLAFCSELLRGSLGPLQGPRGCEGAARAGASVAGAASAVAPEPPSRPQHLGAVRPGPRHVISPWPSFLVFIFFF